LHSQLSGSVNKILRFLVSADRKKAYCRHIGLLVCVYAECSCSGSAADKRDEFLVGAGEQGLGHRRSLSANNGLMQCSIPRSLFGQFVAARSCRSVMDNHAEHIVLNN